MRIFLDANILFSASLAHSRMRAFLDVLSDQGTLLTNAYAAEEARRNLEMKFPASLRQLKTLTRKCELVPGIITDIEITLPSKDIPILGGAIAGHATHLLTGDERDFGTYFGRTIQGVKIVSPRLLIKELGM
jgi:uncharacterized protein